MQKPNLQVKFETTDALRSLTALNESDKMLRDVWQSFLNMIYGLSTCFGNLQYAEWYLLYISEIFVLTPFTVNRTIELLSKRKSAIIFQHTFAAPL